MIVYNGASGSLGKYLPGILAHRRVRSYAFSSRLEDRPGLWRELVALPTEDHVTFFHLAARVSVPACEADPDDAYRINVELARATVEDVLDWAAQRGMSSRIVYVSSGHVYEAAARGSRVAETSTIGPRSIYAETKLAAEEVMRSFHGHRVDVIIARVFGLVAPRQPSHYVLPGLVQRALANRLESIPGLDYVRDYLDARDVCENLLLLDSRPQASQPLLVNVCSGEPTSIRDLLRAVLVAHDPYRADALAESATPAPGRPDDVAWLVGDSSRFVELTGAATRRIPLPVTAAEAVAAAHGPSTNAGSEEDH